MKKIRPIKKNWFDQLIKQAVVTGKKPKLNSDKSKYKIIRDIWILFQTEERKKRSKMKQ